MTRTATDGRRRRGRRGGDRLRNARWIVLLLAAPAALGAAITQPIAFNHHLHVEDAGLECTDCHVYARKGVRATIPNIEVCVDCHEEAMTESAEEARTVEYIRDGVPIPWRKVNVVPEHVYFSHRRHTAVGGIECGRCHGPIEEREVPLTRPLVRMRMDDCMQCHQERAASNDCVSCHR